MKKKYLLFLIFYICICCRLAAQKWHVAKSSGQRIEVTKELDCRDAIQDAVDFLKPYKAKVDSCIGPIVGESAIYMDVNRPECLLSNWAADVLLAASKRIDGKRQKAADFAVVNIGGLRNAMPKGQVTVGDIMEIAPFENRLAILTLSGEKVLELFQQFSIFGGEGVSHGVELVYDSTQVLQSATLYGKAIKKEKFYRIATLDYLAEGNDNMLAFKDATSRISTKMLVRDIYTDFIRQEYAQGRKLTSHLEGRIKFPNVGGRKTETKSLFITHTNDTHSCILPLNPNFADTTKAGKGGYLRRCALVDSLRNLHPSMLLFDSGDFSQGSPYYNLFHGEVEIGLMNLMRYDAATIGNHEFDCGLDNMARIFRMAKFPIVCCNYDFSETCVNGCTVPYTILERDGVRIGVIGVSPQLEGLVATECYGATKFLDPITEANRYAAYLKSERQCDLIICLSHLGWNAERMNDQILIANSTDIDIVLGGHTHTYFEEIRYVNNMDGRPVPCNQMGKNAQFVGTINIKLSE